MSKSLTRASSGGVHEKSAEEEVAIAAKVAEVLEKVANDGETDEDDEGCRIGGIEVEGQPAEWQRCTKRLLWGVTNTKSRNKWWGKGSQHQYI